MHVDLSVACPVLVVLTAITIATVTDIRWFKIYNALTVPLIVSGLVYQTALAHTPGLIDGLAGVCAGGGVLLMLYLMGGMGAGDVKLMAGVGAWLGLSAVFYVLIVSLLAAGVYAAVRLTLDGGFSRTINNLQIVYYRIRALGSHLGRDERIESLVQRGETCRLIPYGAMIAVGVIAWLVFEGVTR